MSANSCKKLVKASADASAKGVQHLLAVLKPDGTVVMSGSDNILHAVFGNIDLCTALQTTIISHRQEEGGVVRPAIVMTFPLLPCSPYSPSWKGSGMIRKVLDDMVNVAGYGKYGKKLGQGEPPLGWPGDVVEWVGYAGAARSKLTIRQMTEIIISMLQANQIDPATHVIQEDNDDVADNMAMDAADPGQDHYAPDVAVAGNNVGEADQEEENQTRENNLKLYEVEVIDDGKIQDLNADESELEEDVDQENNHFKQKMPADDKIVVDINNLVSLATDLAQSDNAEGSDAKQKRYIQSL